MIKIIYECVECLTEYDFKELKVKWDIEPLESCSPTNKIGVCPNCNCPKFFINIFKI